MFIISLVLLNIISASPVQRVRNAFKNRTSWGALARFGRESKLFSYVPNRGMGGGVRPN